MHLNKLLNNIYYYKISSLIFKNIYNKLTGYFELKHIEKFVACGNMLTQYVTNTFISDNLAVGSFMSNFICRNYVYLFYQFYLLQKIRTDNRRHTLTCIQCVETFPSFVLHHYKININSSNNKHSRQNIISHRYHILLTECSQFNLYINYKIRVIPTSKCNCNFLQKKSIFI